ncbi:MAG TPA: OmpA family protein [Solirubrobacteraceae bacterium]|nr:OmpA family protein [Solirubrobacteraceae bacterium]
MARGRGSGRRGSKTEENEERWLLTYADMITLLLALFMVLFSIASINTTKFKEFKEALHDAFSAPIVGGGAAIKQTGSSASSSTIPETSPTVSIMPFSEEPTTESLKSLPEAAKTNAQIEQSSLERLEREVKAYIAEHRLSQYATVALEPRGLVITLLTDKLLFASGSAALSPNSFPLLEEIALLLQLEAKEPVAVEGNTDSVPIDTAQYPSNWELSTARASVIVRFLVAHGVAPSRLAAIGYAEQRPVASNATEAGRAKNRRVEIVLERLYQEPIEG